MSSIAASVLFWRVLQHARVQPEQPEAYYNLALAYLETGDRESAMAQSRTLESLAPDLNKKLLAEMKQ